MVDATVKVARFDPELDTAPHVESYSMQVRETNTVLNVLLDLAADHDPGIAFRRACRSGICGACAVAINGKPVLACETLVSDALDGDTILIEPIPHFRVIKDLVVDMDGFLESLKGVVPWLVLDPAYDGLMDNESVLRLEKSSECILCGICRSDETVTDDDPRARLNPAAAVKAFRLSFDPRDVLGEERAKLARDLGLLDRPLDRSGKLQCPKGIDFGGQIMPSLRAAVAE